MADDKSQLDLRQLAVDRDEVARPTVSPKRSYLTRYLLPLGVFAAFAGLFGWAARDSFLPAHPVTVAPVVVSRAEIKREGAPLFQAAGWVEPRPTPVVASALAPGVVRELLVIEGDHVKQGERVATLIDTDARLALAEARAAHDLQGAEVRSAEATLAAARIKLSKPVELRATLAEAEAALDQVQILLSNLPFAIEDAKTRRNLAAENLRRKRLAGEAVPGRVVREARAELASAENAVDELVARRPKLEQRAESLAERRDALREQLRLLTDETRAVAEAEARLAAFKARLDQTRTRVDAAELQLERMVVRSPIDGCVLSLDARPGQWLSGVSSSVQGSSAVVGLYDPKRLQVRVDVRLEDVPQVVIGQPAQIETAALGSPIAGEVISVTTFADIQKNTLQVKVAVTDPPEVLKPEMLAKVTFIAPPSPVDESESEESPLRLFVPNSVVAMGEGGGSVWVADLASGVARRRSVQLGPQAAEGDKIEVASGLNPTDKLIIDGRGALEDGARIHITGPAFHGGSAPAAAPVARTASTAN